MTWRFNLKVFFKLFMLILFAACASKNKNTETFTIRGTLSDFKGNRLAKGQVRLLAKDFKETVVTETDENGNFLVTAPKGIYQAFYVCKDYKVNNLEFWYWNIPTDKDYNLDIKIHGLEIYGINAWRSYAGAKAYFRPMSLKKGKVIELINNDKNKPAKWPVKISPDLALDDLKVTVDGVLSNVWKIEKVRDQVEENDIKYLDAYIIHFSVNPVKNVDGWQEVCIEAKDKKTKEQGMGCAPMRNL